MKFQLADITKKGPSHAEIWEYFTNKVVPVIRKWQLEDVSSGEATPQRSHPGDMVEPIHSLNSILETILDQIETASLSLNMQLTYQFHLV